MVVLDPLSGSHEAPSESNIAGPSATHALVEHFDRQKIGAKLETWRLELIRHGLELRSLQTLLQTSSFVDDTLQLLDRLTCRIGVIGQVKAGKSSLINALMCKPGLLPTDVNPWTTAVARIHFGRTDAPPKVAAEFTFFEPDEWEQLANGGGKVRELTQSLVPGFKVELLHKHVDAMRRRTEQRLGPKLGSLLGKKHVYPLLSTEDLERYISATLPDDATEEKGVYSDIVKTADIYFGKSEFGFPTTIIDTPGTNDPYLVREEIARRTLESAHLHIVVLTPQQALSPADLALLRILRELSRDRIVVFLNRIDQLGDISADVTTIVQHVQAGLRRDFQGSEFPIVAGSAFWADTALRGSDADIEHAWSARTKAYAQHLAQAGSLVAASSGANDPDERARSLFVCSGLPALFDVLDRLTSDSHAARVLARVSRSFCDLARIGETAAQYELAILEQPGGSDKKQGDGELRAVDATVKTMLSDLQESGTLLIKDHCVKIAEALQGAKRSFSEAECAKLRKAMAAGHLSSWSCDLALLRQQLEEALVGACRDAEQAMSKIETEVLSQLQQVLVRYNPQWASLEAEGSVPGNLELPTIGTPSIVLELAEPWWKRWLRLGRAAQRRTAALNRLIEHEFAAIADAFIQTVRTHLQARQSSALQEANVVYAGFVDLLQEQKRTRQASTSFPSEDLLREQPQLQRVLDVRIAELKKQASDMSLLAESLERAAATFAERISSSR